MTEQDLEPLYRQQEQKLKDTPTLLHRYLFSQIDWRDRLIGIKGPRGTGKSTLVLQHIKEDFEDRDELLYLSLDDLWFSNHDIIETVDYLYTHGVRYLFLDEIHQNKNWQKILKNIYDTYRHLHVVFTGSSMLQIKEGEADLSRRPIIYELKGLSFREFLAFEDQLHIDAVDFNDLLSHHTKIAEEICSEVSILPLFEKYLKYGYYPFYKDVYNGYWERVKNIANMVIDVDYPKTSDVSIGTLDKMKKMLMVIASSVPQTPNMSELYKQLDTDRNQGLKMLYALQNGGLLALLSQKENSLKPLSTPDKIYLDNPTLMYALAISADIGTVRETFFYNQLKKDHEVLYPCKGDFFVDGKYYFEVGGKGKTFDQIVDIDDGYLAVADTEIGRRHRIPLWMCGLLY